MIVLMKFAFVLIGIAGILFLVLRVQMEADRTGRTEPKFSLRSANSVIGGVALLFFMIAITLSVGQVESGERGVVKQFGKVTGKILGDGIYFIVPLYETVELMDVQTRKIASTERSSSKDLQFASTQVTVNYSLLEESVDRIYTELRREYEARVIEPSISEAVKATTALFNAEELITRREEVRDAIESNLKERLLLRGIEVEGMAITGFSFSDVFDQAIEAKVVAEQSALEERNRLEQVLVQAEQAEARAKGEANARIAEAEGLRQASILEASGKAEAVRIESIEQAAANERLNETLSDILVRWAVSQSLSENINVALLPIGTDFILGPEVIGGLVQGDTSDDSDPGDSAGEASAP